MDEIDVVGKDWRPTPTAIREKVEGAAIVVAMDDGTFDIGRIRPLLPPWATGPQVGAAICGLVRSGRVESCGVALSGNTAQRNGTRLVKMYRWVA